MHKLRDEFQTLIISKSKRDVYLIDNLIIIKKVLCLDFLH